MTRITILIFLFAPLIGWAQPTTFTEEEENYVVEFIETLKKRTPLTTNELIEAINEGLEIVPFHPTLVEILLSEKSNNDDFAFVHNYCENLDDEYLSDFQSILFTVCAYTYLKVDDYDGLYNRIIPLIKDRNIKGLHLMAYYFYNGYQEEEFKEHAKYALQNRYEYGILNGYKNYFLEYFIYQLTTENYSNSAIIEITSFLNEYEDAFLSSDMLVFAYYRLIEAAVVYSNLELAKKLIDYVKELYPEKYEYLYPVVAFYHSQVEGEEDLVKKALENTFKMDKAGFLDAYPLEETDFRAIFFKSISLLTDHEDKKKYVEQGVDYLQDIPILKQGLRLYQSMILAPEDLKCAKKILKEYETVLDETNYSLFGDILFALNEVNKKKPDYRQVDAILNELMKINNFAVIGAYYLQVKFRYKVNYNSKKPVFTLNEILEPFEYILTDSFDYKEYFLEQKLKIIGEYDNEWLLRELEKLPKDVADEFIEKFSHQNDDLEKAKELKDITSTINPFTERYLLHLITNVLE